MDELSQEEVTAGKVLAEQRWGELRLERRDREVVARELAGQRARHRGGRPATVPHKGKGYCRCADCRRGRGER